MTGSAFGDLTGPSAGTFMGVPAASPGGPADVVVLGIPFDIGTHPQRVGSRLGPDHVRYLSAQLRPHLVELDGDPFASLTIVDGGNVVVTPGRVEPAYRAIEQVSRMVLDMDAVPLTLGGDGAVTLPQLRAAARRYGPGELAVIHLDAHTDALPGSADEPYTNATTFVRAAEEGLIDPQRCVHLGVRGTSPVPDPVGLARGHGFEVVTMESLRRSRVEDVASALAERFAGAPVYVCWDMDIFDPAVAPGVCTPEWGGLTAAEGIAFIRALTGIRPITVDVNTVSPPHDLGNLTGTLAARIVLEFLYLIDRAAHR
ncbi:arginase family protein [Amycolatopsis jejuensis]|uniref:arginase family protein n=1 Tax=Amycolatopsis jejuensis TaxID=330084 RepID=UPI000B1F31D9|nr:arginase family protein [Amycolatopsis jejuensis]